MFNKFSLLGCPLYRGTVQWNCPITQLSPSHRCTNPGKAIKRREEGTKENWISSKTSNWLRIIFFVEETLSSNYRWYSRDAHFWSATKVNSWATGAFRRRLSICIQFRKVHRSLSQLVVFTACVSLYCITYTSLNYFVVSVSTSLRLGHHLVTSLWWWMTPRSIDWSTILVVFVLWVSNATWKWILLSRRTGEQIFCLAFNAERLNIFTKLFF